MISAILQYIVKLVFSMATSTIKDFPDIQYAVMPIFSIHEISVAFHVSKIYDNHGPTLKIPGIATPS
uniref:Uncharacterized protein n=1 Tax=Arundo donax TaxID=35708 RepID=A0A0A9C3N3_ARUDO